jgi:hypothetical protein
MSGHLKFCFRRTGWRRHLPRQRYLVVQADQTTRSISPSHISVELLVQYQQLHSGTRHYHDRSVPNRHHGTPVVTRQRNIERL